MVVVPGSGLFSRTAAQPDSDNGPRVLLIDRQPLFLAALASLLSGPPLDAQVQVAHQADAGLEAALRDGVDLVFCEVRSEPIPGVEVAERLAQLTPQIPVILLGDSEDERLMAAALSTKAAGMFTKNTSLPEFLVGVQTVLAGHRAVGSNLMGLVLARLSESSPRAHRPANQLSPTELDILTMIGEAKSIPVIAAARGISHKTVRNHLANIYRKLDLRSRTEAMLWAARMGLTAS
ncbi:MAG TPA: response regulator transcription factor [Candidatus Dormibacteraeota bacterium]|nr:response regulator transcription factor [Candidatus Dormibacteraeota bacterium]